MSDAFISYSRKDSEFVQRLSTAFTNANRVVWVDWQNIPRGEDWWREIQSGIEQADAFICVVSEHWLTSEICHNELLYARQQNKRILPLMLQQIRNEAEKRVTDNWTGQSWQQTARENWDAIRHINWVFFDQDLKFNTEFASLIKTLEEDQPHIKAHTRYQTRALEWVRSQQNPSFLLAGDDLTFAEQWLAEGVNKHPPPTEQHRAYIAASRAAEDGRLAKQAARERRIQQFRRMAIALGLIGALALVATAIAVPTSITALNSNATSVAQVRTATLALSTATQVANQVMTATYAQGQAVFAQQTSAAREADSSTQVAIAGATLSPVPPTLAAVATALADAKMQQDIAFESAQAFLKIVEGDTLSGLQIADALVERYPNYPLAYESRGLINENAKQFDQAIADYSHALQLDPAYADAYVNRGNAYSKLGKTDEAIDDYNHALQLRPQIPSIYSARGMVYLQQNKLEDALADFTQALQLDPQLAYIYVNRGIVYAQQGNLNEAINDYSQAIQLDPQASLPYSNRALAYLQQNKLDDAVLDFTQAIQLNPQYTDAYIGRGQTYAVQNKLPEAFADFNQAIQLAPTNATAYFNRGLAYYQQNSLTEAIHDFTEVIRLNPQLLNAYGVRGYLSYLQGDLSSAREDLELYVKQGGILPADAQAAYEEMQAKLTTTPGATVTLVN